jgi:hypothetical protein
MIEWLRPDAELIPRLIGAFPVKNSDGWVFCAIEPPEAGEVYWETECHKAKVVNAIQATGETYATAAGRILASHGLVSARAASYGSFQSKISSALALGPLV